MKSKQAFPLAPKDVPLFSDIPDHIFISAFPLQLPLGHNKDDSSKFK